MSLSEVVTQLELPILLAEERLEHLVVDRVAELLRCAPASGSSGRTMLSIRRDRLLLVGDVDPPEARFHAAGPPLVGERAAGPLPEGAENLVADRTDLRRDLFVGRLIRSPPCSPGGPLRRRPGTLGTRLTSRVHMSIEIRPAMGTRFPGSGPPPGWRASSRNRRRSLRGSWRSGWAPRDEGPAHSRCCTLRGIPWRGRPAS